MQGSDGGVGNVAVFPKAVLKLCVSSHQTLIAVMFSTLSSAFYYHPVKRGPSGWRLWFWWRRERCCIHKVGAVECSVRVVGVPCAEFDAVE